MKETKTEWQLFSPRLSVYQTLPLPLYMKAKNLRPRSKVVDHQHDWDQLIFATQGLLEVQCNDGQHLIPCDQAIWVPANIKHSIASSNGAQLRSVHLQKVVATNAFQKRVEVLKVDPFSRLLIDKVSKLFPEQESISQLPTFTAQQQRLMAVLIDQINQLEKSLLSLPLSNDPLLKPIIEHLQKYPDNKTTLTQWGNQLGASSKTIARRFESEMGISFGRWREQLILHKAIQRLSEQRAVTEVALDLGYGSLPAFIAMFKRQMGVTPGQFHRHYNESSA